MNRLEEFGFGKIAAVATVAVVVFFLTTSGQEMFSAGPLHAQPRKTVTRGGVGSHAEIASCSACHASVFSSDTMADRCMVCHDNIRAQLDGQKAMHGKFINGQQCTDCHTEHKGPHGSLTDMRDFDHACTAFPLVGKHAMIEDCTRCHTDSLYQGTKQTCAGCHARDDVHQGKRGLQCGSCHSPDTWKASAVNLGAYASTSFDHDQTGFKLTGKHKSADCKSCHKNNTFKGTPASCVKCHDQDEKKSHPGKFGNDCQACHSTLNWKSVTLSKEVLVSAKFDHDERTNFKLTGKHKSTDCMSCHKNNTFKGTKQSCVDCHAEPSSHTMSPKQFGGISCWQCHTTTSWKGATLAQGRHRFPINHGNKKNKSAPNACTLCHPQANNFVSTQPTSGYAAYTCFGCHHHSYEKELKRHANRKVGDLLKCATCHKGVPEKKGKAGRPILVFDAEWQPGQGDCSPTHDCCLPQGADAGIEWTKTLERGVDNRRIFQSSPSAEISRAHQGPSAHAELSERVLGFMQFNVGPPRFHDSAFGRFTTVPLTARGHSGL